MAGIKINLLEVDLTRETSRVVDVTEDVKKYLGGRGLANKLIWDLVPPGADMGPGATGGRPAGSGQHTARRRGAINQPHGNQSGFEFHISPDRLGG